MCKSGKGDRILLFIFSCPCQSFARCNVWICRTLMLLKQIHSIFATVQSGIADDIFFTTTAMHTCTDKSNHTQLKVNQPHFTLEGGGGAKLEMPAVEALMAPTLSIFCGTQNSNDVYHPIHYRILKKNCYGSIRMVLSCSTSPL